MSTPFTRFREAPTPANAVALAREDFIRSAGVAAHVEYTDALSLAERQLLALDKMRAQLRALYEAIPHNGEPGSALRRECEATKALIRELETGHA